MDIARLHFLVAEANTAERMALATMLGTFGALQITQTPDGFSAMRLVQDFTPAIDVALIDLALPGMDGVELIRQLAARDPHVRLLVTGAQSDNMMFSIETLAQAYGVDLLGTLSKPIDQDKLQALLANYAPPAFPPLQPDYPAFSFAQIAQGLHARQFEPFFQPKIELASGHVTGLEAFARWRHPEFGVLGPSAFITALEQNKRMDYLDWSMIEKSVERCRHFHDQGIPISISINLSPVTLAHPQFMQQISACVNRHGVAPDYITFEMPESSVLVSDPDFIERLVRLRLVGYGLAIDDYGTGRSNLQLLARVPFTELKIDRSFVDGASRNRALSVVLSSCLGLAKSLDRQSVAVGVETRRDWDFLQGLGCTYAQGYHIASPMAAEEFPGWIEDWQQFF